MNEWTDLIEVVSQAFGVPTYILFHIEGNLWVYPQGLLGEVKSNLMARIIFQLFDTPEH